MISEIKPAGRQGIYYWKCDRPAAFHQLEDGANDQEPRHLEADLKRELESHFSGQRISLDPVLAQGNHLIFRGQLNDDPVIVRVEGGPEGDTYFAAESRIIDEVRKVGVPTPRVYGFDIHRERVPFAWQVLEAIPFQNLHSLNVPVLHLAEDIGRNVALWQKVPVKGFGLFDVQVLEKEDELKGFYPDYESFYFLNLEKHLSFLQKREFLASELRSEIWETILAHRDLLKLDHPCLVHKDLALWNILGSADSIASFIDWDDSLAGDPMDDLSLLACFQGGDFLEAAFRGYESQRALPPNYRKRFWLHLLRNMIVKSVIRVGAGYFSRGGGFFLNGALGAGDDLETFTRKRLTLALRNLQLDSEVTKL